MQKIYSAPGCPLIPAYDDLEAGVLSPPTCGGPLPPPSPPCAGSESGLLPPEIILQNNGQPIVVYAYNQGSAIDSEDIYESDLPIPQPEAPLPAVDEELPELASPGSFYLQSDGEQTYEPKAPCKIDRKTETTEEAGETVIHKPSHIIVNQPPTRLIINHPPLIVKPAPVVLHQGGKTIRTETIRKFLPQPVQVRPVYVRLVKPIEKQILVEKSPAGDKPSCEQKVIFDKPPTSAPCDYASKPESEVLAAEATAETLSHISSPSETSSGSLAAPGSTIELDWNNGELELTGGNGGSWISADCAGSNTELINAISQKLNGNAPCSK